ncbi:MAG: ABC transporter permease [bacterium]
MSNVYEIARKEFLQHIRTKRLFIVGGFLVLLLFFFTFVVGPRIARGAPGGTSAANWVIALYFSGILIGGLQFTQLLAIVLTSDAVCSEWSQRTIFLLLSKPVSRLQFVAGKFLGNLFTVGASLVVVFTLAYLLMMAEFSSAPSGPEVLGFIAMLGIIVIGCATFAALGLFASTLTKSTSVSAMVTLGLWLIGFPLLGSIGVFNAISGGHLDFHSAGVQFWLYLNPAADMSAGVKLLLPNVGETPLGNPLAPPPDEPWIAVLALLAYAALFYFASVAVVRRRNFE